MSEVRLSPIGGWGIFAARMVSALALGARAHGEVAMGLPRRLPEVYDQRLAEAGSYVSTVAVGAEVAATAELLVDRGPFPPEPIVYV